MYKFHSTASLYKKIYKFILKGCDGSDDKVEYSRLKDPGFKLPAKARKIVKKFISLLVSCFGNHVIPLLAFAVLLQMHVIINSQGYGEEVIDFP